MKRGGLLMIQSLTPFKCSSHSVCMFTRVVILGINVNALRHVNEPGQTARCVQINMLKGFLYSPLIKLGTSSLKCYRQHGCFASPHDNHGAFVCFYSFLTFWWLTLNTGRFGILLWIWIWILSSFESQAHMMSLLVTPGIFMRRLPHTLLSMHVLYLFSPVCGQDSFIYTLCDGNILSCGLHRVVIKVIKCGCFSSREFMFLF